MTNSNYNLAVPDKWQLTKLKDVCHKITDGTHKTPKYQESGVRFISIKNIRPFVPINLDSYVKFISQEEHAELIQRCHPEYDDILFPRIGTLGFAKRIDFKETVSIFVGLGLLKPKKEVINPKYLEYWMNHPLIKRLSHEKATGSGRLTLPLAETRKFPIPLAPLNQQKRIVAEIEKQFSRLDEAVANLRRVQANLKRYKAAVLKAAVEGRLVETEAERARHEGRDFETSENLLQRILETRRKQWQGMEKYKEPVPPDTTDLPELPEGWTWATLGAFLVNIEAGKSFKCEGRPPLENEVGVAKVSAVTWGEFNETESKTCLDEKLINEKLLIRSGDFLFSRANTIELVGACVIVKKVTKDIMLSDKTLRFQLLGGLDKWVMYNLRSKFGRQEIERLATGNQQSMRNISQDRIKSIRIPLPPPEKCDRIVAEVDRHLSLAREVETQVEANLKRAEGLRQSILRQAFSGRLLSDHIEQRETA